MTDWLQVTGSFNVLSDRIVRNDGLSWDNLGFAAGQQVSFSMPGGVGIRTVLGFDNATTPSGTGYGSALLLGGPALPTGTNVTGTVAVTNRNVVSGTFTLTSVTRRSIQLWPPVKG